MKTSPIQLFIMFGFITKFFSFCTAVTGGYTKEGDKVYWSGGLSSSARHQVVGVETRTFKELSSVFGKDANQVFYKSFRLDNADVQSFQILNHIYSKDKNKAYFGNFAIAEADASTFRLKTVQEISSRSVVYAFDKNHVYFQQAVLSNDPEHYQYLSISNDISKDNNHVYCYGRIIDFADAASFEALPFAQYNRSYNHYIPYFKDKKHVYFSESRCIKLVQEANPTTFTLITQENHVPAYAKDDKYFFCDGVIVPKDSVK